MPQPRKNDEAPEAVAGPEAAYVEALFDAAFRHNEEYDSLIKRRKANRQALRLMADQDMLNDEQRELLAELYPVRERKAAEDGTEPEATTAAPSGATA